MKIKGLIVTFWKNSAFRENWFLIISVICNILLLAELSNNFKLNDSCFKCFRSKKTQIKTVKALCFKI